MSEMSEVKINYNSVGEQAHIPYRTGPFLYISMSYDEFEIRNALNVAILKIRVQ